ncbi:unnamed protein product [Chondrus crispus]|uniref:Uncharacterized protein n=1 Tax=Chondrus crispus TaxID=2769 RepID=R7Q7D5_CHOCR|nr:unnamed protein product [Chondrus crispus]CDF33743.1 unnamed protein product [Chondrus crispus]|eukprot:XP_005713562.1 unnamed protein product [Chondrus crispus]
MSRPPPSPHSAPLYHLTNTPASRLAQSNGSLRSSARGSVPVHPQRAAAPVRPASAGLRCCAKARRPAADKSHMRRSSLVARLPFRAAVNSECAPFVARVATDRAGLARVASVCCASPRVSRCDIEAAAVPAEVSVHGQGL